MSITLDLTELRGKSTILWEEYCTIVNLSVPVNEGKEEGTIPQKKTT